MGYEEVENGLERSCRATVKWVEWTRWISPKILWELSTIQRKDEEVPWPKNWKTRVYGWDSVLLFNSSLRLFPRKLKSKWTDPYLVTQLFPHGAIELETKEGVRFKVNGQRINIYFGHAESANKVIEADHLDEVWVIKCLQSCRDIKSGVVWEENQYLSFYF